MEGLKTNTTLETLNLKCKNFFFPFDSNFSKGNNISDCGFYIANSLEVNYHIFDIYYDYEKQNEEASKYHDLIELLLIRNKDFRAKFSHFKMKIRSGKFLDAHFKFK